eukprot:symbB.v1.2.027603.t1/scaffold2843.1/size69054/1
MESTFDRLFGAPPAEKGSACALIERAVAILPNGAWASETTAQPQPVRPRSPKRLETGLSENIPPDPLGSRKKRIEEPGKASKISCVSAALSPRNKAWSGSPPSPLERLETHFFFEIFNAVFFGVPGMTTWSQETRTSLRPAADPCGDAVHRRRAPRCHHGSL